MKYWLDPFSGAKLVGFYSCEKVGTEIECFK